MRYLFCVVSSAMLCSCIVVPQTYYMPTSSAGFVERAACETFGPNDSIVIYEGGVSIRVWLQKHRYKESKDFKVSLPEEYQLGKKYLVLSISLTGASYNTVLVKDPAIRIFIDANDARNYRFNSFYKSERVFKYTRLGMQYLQQTYTDVEVGAKLEFPHSEEVFFPYYAGNIWLDVDDADTIRVDHIMFEIDGTNVEIGPIDFTKKSGVYYYPMNC